VALNRLSPAPKIPFPAAGSESGKRRVIEHRHGGHTMTATAAPAYLGNPANVDPEEAFVASLASCHMLTFLSIACKQKFVLDSYEDEAVGHMEKNADGKLAITRVELRPKITWSGNRRPSVEELDKMHHAAHENCFIANSVKTNVTVAER
jgi:organic hydroperoxide reductase OsmC/OhrA